VDAIVITHPHYDHIGGIPEFYRVQKKLDIHTTDLTGEIISSMFSFMKLNINRVEFFKPFEIFGVEYTLFPVDHPPLKESAGVILRYEGSKIVFTGDTSSKLSDEVIELIRSPDLLIADAIHPTLSFNKHMNANEAFELSKRIDAKETLFIHMSHLYPPHAVASKKYPLSYDGMRIAVENGEVIIGESVQKAVWDFGLEKKRSSTF